MLNAISPKHAASSYCSNLDMVRVLDLGHVFGQYLVMTLYLVTGLKGLPGRKFGLSRGLDPPGHYYGMQSTQHQALT